MQLLQGQAKLKLYEDRLCTKEALPKSNGYVYTNIGNWDTTPAKNILMRVGVTGELAIWCASGNENVAYFGSFSYPVAE